LKYKIQRMRFIFVAFILLPISFYGQKSISLTSILKSIEQQHKVTFNYNPELVKDVAIVAPKKQLNLKQKLNYLSLETVFVFEVLKNNIISIQKQANSEIVC